MVLNTDAEPKKVLDLVAGTQKKVLKIVPKSRIIKGSRPPLKPFMVRYDTFFFKKNVVENLEE